tara:strand:+ start:2361 stop:5483 length:3123 start_codon:yes stop_codon:yes gene_type:complete
MSFELDVKGSNTQLIPVVKIEDDYFSTSSISLGDVHCKPLLMNVPSIKQSLGIESRKFKISSVTIDISNYVYSGQRFTDRLSESSLINKEMYIYFKTQSMTSVEELHEVFYGRIRSINHDDSKVSLQAEDLTEIKLHKLLPSEETGSTPEIPDKFRNTPYPMVYGKVDKSPLIPYYAIIQGIDDDEFYKELALKADYRDIKDFIDTEKAIGLNTSMKVNTLSFFENDTYWNVARTNSDSLGGVGIENYRDSGSDIIIDSDSISAEEGEMIENDTAKGRLRVHQIRTVKHTSFEPAMQQGFEGTQGVSQLNFTNEELGKITGTIDVNMDGITSGLGSPVAIDNSTWGYIKAYLEDANSPNNLSKKTFPEFELDERGQEMPPITFFFINAVHYNNFQDNPNSGGEIDTSAPFTNYRTRFGFWVGGSSSHFAVAYANSGEVENYQDAGFDTQLSDGNLYFNNISGNDSLDQVRLNELFQTVSQYNHIKIGIPKHTIYGVDKDLRLNVYFLLKDFFIVQQFFVDGIGDREYYANVEGRIDSNDELIENPIDIIYDLVTNELNHDNIDIESYNEAREHHSDEFTFGWKFAFTVSDKIDSKKLIEDIAKSTKCYPKFNNDGSFGFNTIKSVYRQSDYEKATLIKESEVINYSFSKTRPEQIYTKVKVSYSKDYGQNVYLDSIVRDEGADPYYGIEDSDEAFLDFECDYIRDSSTAFQLASFLYNQHKNQHLLLKLKLPLKYIDIESGNLIKFNKLLDNVTAYGINYAAPDAPNNQWYYPLFMVTSVSKNLDSVSIECMQLHHLGEVGIDVSIDGEIYDEFFIKREGDSYVVNSENFPENTGKTTIVESIESPVIFEGDLVESNKLYFAGSSQDSADIFGQDYDRIPLKSYIDESTGNPYFDFTLYTDIFRTGQVIRITGVPEETHPFAAALGIQNNNNGDYIVGSVSPHEITLMPASAIEGIFSPPQYLNTETLGQTATYTIQAFDSSSVLLGDLNQDGGLNVLDIVKVVTIMLYGGDSDLLGDLNQDGNVNVLDIVQMINIILED